MSEQHKPVLSASDIPLVALESMNQTHREEVELINHLGELLQAARDGKPDLEAIDRALDVWIDHTASHFERENRLMEQYGFPPYPVHAGEHANVLAELNTLRERWRQHQDPEPVARYLFDKWPAWFDMHVKSMDKVTAQFLSKFID